MHLYLDPFWIQHIHLLAPQFIVNLISEPWIQHLLPLPQESLGSGDTHQLCGRWQLV